jgi:hypothetical protein
VINGADVDARLAEEVREKPTVWEWCATESLT